MKAIALFASPRMGAPMADRCRRLAPKLRAWFAARCQAACQHAERPERVVPYY
ncbi:hypothetical protein [uncultured Hydrogenophaga sp.]|uniref:hypothetical protein n=1 Tax=uncultured Hydrogenophaga sp. TaxID=199683 RepID=UPI002586DF50|nr:hypothetical protein [uncultured Hydrogenophaga sp.]